MDYPGIKTRPQSLPTDRKVTGNLEEKLEIIDRAIQFVKSTQADESAIPRLIEVSQPSSDDPPQSKGSNESPDQREATNKSQVLSLGNLEQAAPTQVTYTINSSSYNRQAPVILQTYVARPEQPRYSPDSSEDEKQLPCRARKDQTDAKTGSPGLMRSVSQLLFDMGMSLSTSVSIISSAHAMARMVQVGLPIRRSHSDSVCQPLVALRDHSSV